MSDSTCVICLEPLASHPLGVCVPCGHCVHQHCFAGWKQASSRSRSVKCSTCNSTTSTFCKVFLDLNNPNDDDDLSLSSLESVEEEEEKEESQQDSRTSLSNADGEGAEENDDNADGPPAGSNADEEQAREQPEEIDGELINDTDGHPDVIEIDDNSVVEILSNASVPSSPARRPPPKRKRTGDNTTEDASRIRRKAKRLKKQNKFLETQLQEFVERERKLLEDFSKSRDKVKELEQEQEEYQNKSKSTELELAHNKLLVTRLRRQREEVWRERDELREKMERTRADLSLLQKQYRNDVANAQSKAMQEVSVMVERQPKLIQDNHYLNEALVKKNQQLEELKQKLDSLRTCIRRETASEMVKQRSTSAKSAKLAARALEEVYREQRKQEAEEKNRARIQAKKAATAASRPSKTYSAQASRVSVAGLKVAAKQKNVMDVLGTSPSRANDGKRVAIKAIREPRHRHASTMEESADTESIDAASIIGGSMSLNLASSTKKRKIEPLPIGKTGTTKAKKANRRKDGIQSYFNRN